MTAAHAFQAISGSGDDLRQVVAVCAALRDYCLIGVVAINCYVEPVYTMDADFTMAVAHLEPIRKELLGLGFKVEDHLHSFRAIRPDSQFHIQFTKDARYADFPKLAEVRETLDLRLHVAALPNLVQAKIWAWSDSQRRLSKRKNDELDLIRIAEKFPQFTAQMPEAIRPQLS